MVFLLSVTNKNGRFVTSAHLQCYYLVGKVPKVSMWLFAEFIRSQTANHSFHLWIGLHRVSRGQGWAWLDNSVYTNDAAYWRSNQPDNNKGVWADILMHRTAILYQSLYISDVIKFVSPVFICIQHGWDLSFSWFLFLLMHISIHKS